MLNSSEITPVPHETAFAGRSAPCPAPHWQVRQSDAVQDSAWDKFLESTSQGEYQQSSLWAEAKAAEGWQCSRSMITASDGQILGGFQFLYRRKKGLCIGYLSRGPVLVENPVISEQALLDLVAEHAKQLGLSAFICQPSRPAHSIASALKASNAFIPGDFRLIRSTIFVDVREGIDAVRQNFRRCKRQELNQSTKLGITVRDGTEQDLPAFFNLMLLTCRRQQSIPSPATLQQLTAIWKAFSSRGKAWLRLAEMQGTLVSGWLALLFGKTVTFYKLGWNGLHPEAHPNTFQIDDLLARASAAKLHFCDFAAAHPALVDALQRGRKFAPEEKTLRDFYKTGFGGTPVWLPTPYIWVRNPLFRALYKLSAPLLDRKARALPCPAAPP